MSNYRGEQLDELIAQGVRQHMDDAGEPRADLLWAKIQKDVRQQESTRRPFITRLFRWQVISAGAMAACLFIALTIYPGALTEIGKRSFLDSSNLEQVEDSGVSVASREFQDEKVKVGKAAEEQAFDNTVTPMLTAEVPEGERTDDTGSFGIATTDQIRNGETPSARKLPPLGLGGSTPLDADADGVQMMMVPDSELLYEEGSFILHEASDIAELRRLVPFPVLYPTDLPDGFAPDRLSYLAYDDRTGETMITITKEGSLGHLDLTQRNVLIDVPLDDKGPDVTRKAVQVGGNEATLTVTRLEEGEYSNINWVQDGITYWISGRMSAEELKAIADSLKP